MCKNRCDSIHIKRGILRKFNQHHRHNYGQLLILNAGEEYHVLLAGMERISVDSGQFVLTGEHVAVMGGGDQSTVAKAGGAPRTLRGVP